MLKKKPSVKVTEDEQRGIPRDQNQLKLGKFSVAGARWRGLERLFYEGQMTSWA